MLYCGVQCSIYNGCSIKEEYFSFSIEDIRILERIDPWRIQNPRKDEWVAAEIKEKTGDDVELIEHIEQSEKKGNYYEHMIFISPSTKKLYMCEMFFTEV